MLARLVDLHQQLLAISKDKTTFIKSSDHDQLVKLLTKERQVIQQVEKLEKERIDLVDDLFQTHGKETEEKTYTDLLDLVEDGETKTLLERLGSSLIHTIVLLRENEQLNRELLEQSMQLTQLTLEMLQPETKQIQYGSKSKPRNPSEKRSVFDSKV